MTTLFYVLTYCLLTAFAFVVDKSEKVSTAMLLGLIAIIVAGPLHAGGLI